MTNKSKAIAVTGAAGFIGSHLCKRLLSEKYKVIGIDDLSKGSVKNLKEIKCSAKKQTEPKSSNIKFNLKPNS